MHHTQTITQIDAIRAVCPSASNIRTPNVTGVISPVYIADTDEGTDVFKFNKADMATRNAMISIVLGRFDIPMPRIRVHRHMNMHIERYPFCADQTLFEYMQTNPSMDALTKIYKQLFELQYRISGISREWLCYKKSSFPSVFLETSSQRVAYPLALTYAGLVALMSKPGVQQIFHNDINTKNVLIDANGNVSRLLDMDGISLSSETFSTFMTLRHAPVAKYDELFDYYESMLGHSINRRVVLSYLTAANTTRLARKIIDDIALRTK